MSGSGRDLNTDVAVVASFVPALRTTTVTGTGVDLAGFTKAMVLVAVGAVTDGTHTLTIEESDNDSDYTTATAISGAFTAAATATKTQEVGYLGSKRYIRVVSTITGSPSTGGIYGAYVVKAGARTLPQ